MLVLGVLGLTVNYDCPLKDQKLTKRWLHISFRLGD